MTSEKEKCLRGELYDADNDKELIAERQACKEICHSIRIFPDVTVSDTPERTNQP